MIHGESFLVASLGEDSKVFSCLLSQARLDRPVMAARSCGSQLKWPDPGQPLVGNLYLYTRSSNTIELAFFQIS